MRKQIKPFEKCRQALLEATLLAHPREGAPLNLTTNASKTAVGAILEQITDVTSLAFFSKKLSIAKKYNTYDCELFAIYKALKYLRLYFNGWQLIIKTNHKPLIFK